jgi:hypothetical protein
MREQLVGSALRKREKRDHIKATYITLI